jgi:hypothetical protein
MENYEKQLDEISNKILDRSKDVAKEIGTINMAPKIEMPTPITPKIRRTRKKQENSNLQLIIKALQNKELKTVEDIIKDVQAKKPEELATKLKSSISVAQSFVRKKRTGFNQYEMDEDNFHIKEVQKTTI